jgi:predicted MFS family arabinose efflux permease
VSQIIAALSVLALVFLDGVAGAMLCVTLLAVNTAIASNGQGAYALSLPAAERFGRSRTMGFYNVAMRLGQVFGPLSLGLLMTAWDARTGLSILAAFTGICALLFILFSLGRRRAEGMR